MVFKSYVDLVDCKIECTKYSWCRGIRRPVSGNQCGLLRDQQSSTISGWENAYPLNWVEPDQWKNSGHNGYKCFEKVKRGRAILRQNKYDVFKSFKI